MCAGAAVAALESLALESLTCGSIYFFSWLFGPASDSRSLAAKLFPRSFWSIFSIKYFNFYFLKALKKPKPEYNKILSRFKRIVKLFQRKFQKTRIS